MQEYVYSVAEVAKILKVNKNYVYELINKGQLKALKLGSLKVPRWCLLVFLKEKVGQDLSDLENIKPFELSGVE